MDIGDKVKLIKGNPFGKIGIIKQVQFMAGPVNVTVDPEGLKKAPHKKHFLCEADDGTEFYGTDDSLESIK